jgi:ATP-dependent exoDNAse (exonuclease V) beta subunit
VSHALRHELFARARAADARGACRRETPVTLMLDDNRMLEGIVDLAFEDGETWTVVDYKTDAELAGEGEARYRQQVALYTSAVARATERCAVGVLARV